MLARQPTDAYGISARPGRASRRRTPRIPLVMRLKLTPGSFGAEVIMFQAKAWKKALLHGVRLAALAATVSLAFGSLAWADDDDYYYRRDNYRHDEAREHGYRNGYQDGVERGQYDRMQGYRYNYKSGLWEDAGGFERLIGAPGRYKHAYRSGDEKGQSPREAAHEDRRR